MFWKRNKEIDLGWIKLEANNLTPPENYEDHYEFTSDLFYRLFGNYSLIFYGQEESLRDSLRYRIQSQGWLSEIEDLVRTGLYLFDKIIIETPYPNELQKHFGWEDFISEEYIDMEKRSAVYCNYTFFDAQALHSLSKLLGDAISREVSLLPSFDITGDEYEEVYDEEYDAWITYGNETDRYHLSEFWNRQSYVEHRLNRCNQLEFEDSIGELEHPLQYEISVPVIKDARLTDLLRLRRDEKESFLRWRSYLNNVLSHSNKSHDEISQAITEGLAELRDRFSLLKRKGLLDALGGGLISASAAVAFFVEGQSGTIAGTLATLSSAAAVAKAMVEVRAEQRELSKNDLYFLWLTRKLHDWD